MSPLEHAEAMEQTANVIRRCRSGQPTGFKLQSCHRNAKSLHWHDTDGDGAGASQCFTEQCVMYYRLVEIPKPVMIPLGPEDVPPGSALMWTGNTWTAIVGTSSIGVILRNREETYEQLMSDNAFINRPGEDWKPCHKLA